MRVCQTCENNNNGLADRAPSLLLLHVEDILIVAIGGNLQLFTEMMNLYKDGPLEMAMRARNSIYLGLSIEVHMAGSHFVNRRTYIENLASVSAEHVVRNGKYTVNRDRWGTSARNTVGGLLRRCQTCFDVCPVSTYISTSAVGSLEDPILAMNTIRYRTFLSREGRRRRIYLGIRL